MKTYNDDGQKGTWKFLWQKRKSKFFYGQKWICPVGFHFVRVLVCIISLELSISYRLKWKQKREIKIL
jgi:hypothetical protein